MADPVLLWLPPGALSSLQSAQWALWWRDSSAAVQAGGIDEALIACRGRTVRLVLSVSDVLLTEVTLNRKQARHLQRVVPWLLEEQLLELPEHMWFASGQSRLDRYPVIACPRQALKDLLQHCEALGLVISGICVDAQLLSDLAPAAIEIDEQLLILAGADQALMVPVEQQQDILAVLGLVELDSKQFDRAELLGRMLQTVRQGQHIELLQGELRPAEHVSSGLLSRSWYQTLVLAAACVATVAILMGLQGWRYAHLADQRWQQASSLYNELFPGDRASPLLESQFRNRISRLDTASSGGFLSLMMPVGASLSASAVPGLETRRVHYDERENALTLDVQTNDYEGLEALRDRISAGGLQAEIANYRSQGNSVTARLRVTAGS